MITKMYDGIDTVDITLKLLKRVPCVDPEITININNSLRKRCCHACEIEHITRCGSLGGITVDRIKISRFGFQIVESYKMHQIRAILGCSDVNMRHSTHYLIKT